MVYSTQNLTKSLVTMWLCKYCKDVLYQHCPGLATTFIQVSTTGSLRRVGNLSAVLKFLVRVTLRLTVQNCRWHDYMPQCDESMGNTILEVLARVVPIAFALCTCTSQDMVQTWCCATDTVQCHSCFLQKHPSLTTEIALPNESNIRDRHSRHIWA